MNSSDNLSPGLPTATRVLRYSAAPELLLHDIAHGSPTYVHAANAGCELSAIAPLHSPIIDEQERLLFYPECGLSISLKDITGVHAMMIPRPTSPAYSLEIGLPTATRALSLMAIPECSDMERFTAALCGRPSTIISEKELSSWQRSTTLTPEMCPCCKAAAKARESEPDKHPLSRILRHATRERISLLCRLVSSQLAFTTWITPEQFRSGNGRICAIDTGGRGVLEINVGQIHSLWTLRQKIDGEDYTLLRAFDPLGRLHLEISTPELRLEPIWRGLCREQEY